MNRRRLHIGALKPSPGWETLNSQPLEGIDHVCDARDLSCFADGTFNELYASHVLEHFDYRDEVSSVLAEWYRVLAPGGKIYISVPDLDTISRLFCDRVRFDANDRFMMMRMIMGGHSDNYDYHHAAFNQEFLVFYLAKSGFDKIKREVGFGFFDDTSSLSFKGELISLNLMAEKKSLTKQTTISMATTVGASQAPSQSGDVSIALENKIVNTAARRLIDISIEKVIKLHEAGYTDQAIDAFADLLTIYPDDDEVMYKLARLYQCAGRAEDALPLLKRITTHSPYYADGLYMLGIIQGGRRDFAGGVDCLTRLMKIDDSRVDCYNNLARFLTELGRPEEAQSYLLRSIQVAPDYADTYNYLGNLFLRYWRLSEASEQYQRVIELWPDSVSAYSNLAWIAALEGNIAEAVALFSMALKLQPDFRIAANNLLFTLNYSDSHSPEQVRDEHFRLADQIYNKPVQEHTIRQLQPGEKIRIGYVSGDFKAHSVAFFLEPVLSNHNADNFEIYCYDMVSVPDETTQRMMNLGWIWRTIYGLSDSWVADQIRADGIDILVDLSGHTEGNRLGVFALCAAPLQVSWLGYPNTTGLKQINFRLTDALADPPGMTDHLHSESLVRLPRSFLCYSPPSSTPALVSLPEGQITFGCFNNFPKISETTIHLWARVLNSLPGSQLFLKNGSLRDANVRDKLTDRFAVYGIERSRLIFAERAMTCEEHLQRYGACHIVLDTYPYHGTTTTCEALWMGVPVVTLAGVSHAARVGVSILKNVGLPELIALNADRYVEIAVSLALNPVRLRHYRHSLREQMLASPLMDATAFTEDLEQAYRRMMEQSNT